MTEQQAETIANVLIGLAAAGAAIYVLKTPALRQAVFALGRRALAAAGPPLVEEARRAWRESGGTAPGAAL